MPTDARVTGQHTTKPTRRERQFRPMIAVGMLVITISALIVISLVTVFAAASEDRAEVAQDIFNSLLPVFAAWVGTVLAFYFGQANFESASEQAQNLVAAADDRGGQAAVTELMQPIHDMVVLSLPVGAPEDYSGIELSKIQSEYLRRVNRLLVIDASDHPVLLFHKSRIDEYLLSLPGDDERESATLKDFLDAERSKTPPVEYGPGHGFAVISASETVASAKLSMDAASGVSDLVVTRSGSVDEAVWGWITDVQLGERLRA